MQLEIDNFASEFRPNLLVARPNLFCRFPWQPRGIEANAFISDLWDTYKLLGESISNFLYDTYHHLLTKLKSLSLNWLVKMCKSVCELVMRSKHM